MLLRFGTRFDWQAGQTNQTGNCLTNAVDTWQSHRTIFISKPPRKFMLSDSSMTLSSMPGESDYVLSGIHSARGYLLLGQQFSMNTNPRPI